MNEFKPVPVSDQHGNISAASVYQAWLADKTRYVASIISHYNYRQHQRTVNGYFLMFKEIV